MKKETPVRLVLRRENAELPKELAGACGDLKEFESLRRIAGDRGWRASIRSWDEVWIVVPTLRGVRKPLITMMVARLFARHEAYLVEPSGAKRTIRIASLLLAFLRFLGDFIALPYFLFRARFDIANLRRPRTSVRLGKGSALYLRTDMVLGLRSGGSVGHIAGVLNNLATRDARPIFYSTSSIPTVADSVKSRLFELPLSMWNVTEGPQIASSRKFIRQIEKENTGSRFAFVYQRCSAYNYSALALATQMEIPLITEFNSSAVWVNRNWGSPLKFERLASAIEEVNLSRSDLIVVVSNALKDQLIDRGVPESRILVNPNGVDIEIYSPEIDGSRVRQRYGLESQVVLGFIGTFGRWHGAEVLAEAFGRLLSRHPQYVSKARLLMIGDGMTRPLVEKALDRYSVAAEAVLTGTVPQAEGPEYLAACDILVSPHVPNPDGSAFFGSPTKLYEYMAMGKGIVASDLGQIGETLVDHETAILVEPGNADALSGAMKLLIDDPKLREALGEAARKAAVANHTWARHVERTMKAIGELAQ